MRKKQDKGRHTPREESAAATGHQGQMENTRPSAPPPAYRSPNDSATLPFNVAQYSQHTITLYCGLGTPWTEWVTGECVLTRRQSLSKVATARKRGTHSPPCQASMSTELPPQTKQGASTPGDSVYLHPRSSAEKHFESPLRHLSLGKEDCGSLRPCRGEGSGMTGHRRLVPRAKESSLGCTQEGN